MSESATAELRAKFADPQWTADGQKRARVAFKALKTLWVNTGTLCNLTCRNCYIESSPRNDRLAYFRRADLRTYLDEIERYGWPTDVIGFTGGEPFMNPDILAMLEDALEGGHDVLLLTNAMRPMMRHRDRLLELRARFASQLTLRVSLDHYAPTLHEEERGAGSWEPALEGLRFLAQNRFRVSIAGRRFSEESETQLRAGYARLFRELGLSLDTDDPEALILFPEMDEHAPVPEITDACWGILGVRDEDQMCASARMVVRRKGAKHPAVVACTLLPYDDQFELGRTLCEAGGDVALNHPHCARFCVLGGASCGGAS